MLARRSNWIVVIAFVVCGCASDAPSHAPAFDAPMIDAGPVDAKPPIDARPDARPIDAKPPPCTVNSCPTGHYCNTTTGLCEANP